MIYSLHKLSINVYLDFTIMKNPILLAAGVVPIVPDLSLVGMNFPIFPL